jgi:hypothetical protein
MHIFNDRSLVEQRLFHTWSIQESEVYPWFHPKMDTIAKLQRKTSIHRRASVKTDEEEFKGRSQDQEWKDSSKINNCSLCSKAFTLTNRKHHCRECGGVFCGPCSAYKVVISGTLKRVSAAFRVFGAVH